MKCFFNKCFILIIISLILTISKCSDAFYILITLLLSFISPYTYITILPLILLKKYLLLIFILSNITIILLIKKYNKTFLFPTSLILLLSIFIFYDNFLISLIYLLIFIPILIIAWKTHNFNINMYRIVISSILISILFLSTNKTDDIIILFIILYLLYYLEAFVSVVITCIVSSVFTILKSNYSLVLIILIPLIFLIHNNKKYTINTKKYLNYFLYLKKYNERTSSFNNKIDIKIDELSNLYCFRCSNFKECIKKKLSYYIFLYTCIVNTSINNSNETIKKYALICPNYKRFLLGLRPNYNLDFNINIIKSITEDITLIDNKLETKLHKLGITIPNLNVEQNLITFNNNDYYLNQIKIIERINQKKYSYKIINNTVYLYIKPKITCDIEAISISKDNNKLCGDNYKILDLGYRQIIILSDGMGSGFNAYSESSQMINLVSNIALLNFNTDKTMSLIKNGILYKNNKSSYATLDYLDINCKTQELSLFKFASTSTYIIRNNHIDIYENENLPLGFDKLSNYYKLSVKKGDIVLLFSDGITEHIKKNTIINILSKINNYDAHKLVYYLNNYVCANKLNYYDDITIIAIKIS